jgi:DNA-binding transcriptional regulator YbjK
MFGQVLFLPGRFHRSTTKLSDSNVVRQRQRGTRRRGEQTRERIVEAAMRVIAREGVRGTTHRAVATEADVQLSLTTYYFRNLGELISAAFTMFMERDREDVAKRWTLAFRYLDRFDQEALQHAETRDRIVKYVTHRIVEHMRENLEIRPEGLAIEHHFFFEALVDPELKRLSELHRERLLAPVLRFCRYFNASDPDTDAELLLGTITRLEYESLLVDARAIDYRSIRRQVHRIVNWIINAS